MSNQREARPGSWRALVEQDLERARVQAAELASRAASAAATDAERADETTRRPSEDAR